jgi:hypothetical protein
VFFLFAFFIVFSKVNAGVIINEVQIGGATTSDEFIELYNNSSSDIDLSGWYLKKRTSTGAEYSLVATSRLEGKTISANSYFLLGNENGYAGSVSLDATWASSNTIASNNQIVLFSLSDSVDTVSIGSLENGKSYQKTDSGWITANPTPKSANSTNASDSGSENFEESGGNSESGSSSSSSISGSSGSFTEKATKPKVKIIPTYRATIIAPKLAFVGQPIEINLEVKYGDSIYACGKYFWNFGDGDSKKVEGGFEKFTHTFYYPGEYNISLEYFNKKDTALPDETDEITVKVVPLTVFISGVGDYKDFFIELSNEADYRINISDWVLSSGIKSFVIPKNTNISANSSLTIPGRVSGFVYGDQKDLKLFMPTGEVIFDYNLGATSVKKAEIEQTEEIFLESEEDETQNESLGSDVKINDQIKSDLAAASTLSGQESAFSKYGFIIGLGLFLLVGTVAIYFVRRNSAGISKSDNFETIDE